MQTWCQELCKTEKLLEKNLQRNIDAVKNSHGLAVWGSLHSSVCFSFGHQSLLQLSVLYPHDSVFCMRETVGIYLGIKASVHGLWLPKQKFGIAGM